MDKIDSMQEQTGNVSRDGNSQKEPKINAQEQNNVTEVEDAFDGLVSKDSQLSKPELEEMKTETAKAEKQNKTG